LPTVLSNGLLMGDPDRR